MIEKEGAKVANARNGVRGDSCVDRPDLDRPKALLPLLRKNINSVANFATLFKGQFCEVAVRRGYHGLHEVRFVLKHRHDEPTSVHDTLVLAADEVNHALKAVPNVPTAPLFKVYLMGHNASRKLLPRDLVVEFTPVVVGSGNRTGAQHDTLLKSRGLLSVPSLVLKISVAAFRIGHGFPADRQLIGTPMDTADLLQGYCVRTAPAPRCYSVKTTSAGVGNSFARHLSHREIVVAGGTPSEDLRLLLRR